MNPTEAIEFVFKHFPFKGYMEPGLAGAYLNIAGTVLRYLRPGGKILDFGCGPCDKTAILQFLGFQCSGYDDLKEGWHKIPGNVEKILAFTKAVGIDFKLANCDIFPFEKNYFDMIMLHDVLEHLHDSPRIVLNDLLELSNAAGLLFITVPNAVNIRKRIRVLLGKSNLPRFEDYYWYPGEWRGHVREYVKDDLIKLVKYLNLEILELRSIDNMLQDVPRAVQLGYLVFTDIFKGLKDSWLLVAKKNECWQQRKTLPKEKLVKILEKKSWRQFDDLIA